MLLEGNKMQVHKGPPEEERLVACSLLLLRRLEKKRVQESALASLGVAVWEKRICVLVPGMYLRDSQPGPLSVLCPSIQTLRAEEKAR